MSAIDIDDFFKNHAHKLQLNTKESLTGKCFRRMFDIFDEEFKRSKNAKIAYDYVKLKLLNRSQYKYSRNMSEDDSY